MAFTFNPPLIVMTFLASSNGRANPGSVDYVLSLSLNLLIIITRSEDFNILSCIIDL
jgi:hypothetical protein